MEPITFKQCKGLKIDGPLLIFLQKAYGESSISPKVKQFVDVFNQSKMSFSAFSPKIANSLSELQKYKEMLIRYIYQIKILSVKLSYLNLEVPLNYEFCWTDTVLLPLIGRINYKATKSPKISGQLKFEYYNVLFNLATTFYLLGNKYYQDDQVKDVNTLKDTCKNYQYAIFLFDKVKSEARGSECYKDLDFVDLSDSYLNLCINLCKAKTQKIVIEIAKSSGISKNVIAQLYRGLSSLYNQLYKLSESADLFKYSIGDKKAYYKNRTQYYDAQMFMVLRDMYLDKFNETGAKYGEALIYQEKVVKLLKINVDNRAKSIEIGDDITGEYNQQKSLLEKMRYNNDKIYRCLVPNIEGEVYESKIMAKAIEYPDLDEGKENSTEYANLLSELLPPQAIEMVNTYKQKINFYTVNRLCLQQNEDKVNEFIRSLDLPSCIVLNSNVKCKNFYKIDDGLWGRIEDIQKKQGLAGILNIIDNNIKNNYAYEARLKETFLLMDKEEKEDIYYRNCFMDKWLVSPSQSLNMGYKTHLQQAIEALNKSKPFDQKAKNEVQELRGKYDMLTLTREGLDNMLPGNSNDDIKCTSLSETENKIKNLINELLDLAGQCVEFETKCNKAITEQEINTSIGKVVTGESEMDKELEKGTSKIDALVEEYDIHSKKVIAKELELQNFLNQRITDEVDKKIKEEKVKKNIEFINNLDKMVMDFLTKYNNYVKGKAYYQDLFDKMDTLMDSCYEFLNKRNEEKNYLYRTLTGSCLNFKIYPTRSNKGALNKY